jgi:hypothetical protein
MWIILSGTVITDFYCGWCLMSVGHLLLILLWMVSYVNGTVITDFIVDGVLCVSGTVITDFIVDGVLCQWYSYY